MLVMLVAAEKICFEEQSLVEGTKQSRQAGWQGSQADKAVRPTRQSGRQGSQADKAVRPTRQSGHLTLFCARYWLLCIVEVDVLQNNLFLEQSTFLRYLWCWFIVYEWRGLPIINTQAYYTVIKFLQYISQGCCYCCCVTHSVPNVIKLLRLQITDVQNKLECLSLASLYSLI
jgi:hypothetical protein